MKTFLKDMDKTLGKIIKTPPVSLQFKYFYILQIQKQKQSKQFSR